MFAILHLTTDSVRQTLRVPAKPCEVPLHGQTRSGYGKAMPTPYMVQLNDKWRRVKLCCNSNIGTMYIGNMFKDETKIIVQSLED